MKLTGTEINKAYSEQLGKLLSEGYQLIIARENGSGLSRQEYGRGTVILEKEGKRYEFGFWYEGFNQNTGKHTLGLVEFDKYRWKHEISESENLLETPFTYYSHSFGSEGIYHPYKYFVFSTEEEALELHKKREEREAYDEWLREGIINTFKLESTKFQGFKKDVTVISKKNMYILVNKNGREGYLAKADGSKYWNNLKIA